MNVDRWLQLVGLVFTIFSAAFGIYAYSGTQRHRQLTYYVYPARTVVAKSGEAKRLQVIFEGTHVMDAHVTIWNQGREPIYRIDVLSEVRITTTPPVKVLKATIRKVTRQEIGFARGSARFHDGVIPITWRILEQRDGAIVQLIYAGLPITKISVEGTIVGQKRISAVDLRGEITSPSAEELARLEQIGKDIRTAFPVFLSLLFLFVLELFLLPRIRIRSGIAVVIVFVTILLMVPTQFAFYMWIDLVRSDPFPPLSLDR